MARKNSLSTAGRIRWDRVGRYALVMMFAGIVYLYISPVCNWVGAYGESQRRNHELAALQTKHAKLVDRVKALKDEDSIEQEARRRGMVKYGEKAYVIEGLD